MKREVNDYKNEIIKFGQNFIEEEKHYKVFFDFKTKKSFGWKIHISANIKCSYEIAKLAISYCFFNKVTFKIIKNVDLLVDSSQKKSSLGFFGKFITVYPKNSIEFKKIIEELYLLFKPFNFKGPYIYTDKRYKDSQILYYRYGAISPQILYNFEKTPFFIYKKQKIYLNSKEYYSAFNKKHAELEKYFEVYNKYQVQKLNKIYFIDKVLVSTNAGNIYTGYGLNKQKIIIKEYRPWSEMTKNNAQAIDYAFNSLEIRKRISKLNDKDNNYFIPKIIDSFYEWENYFIVEEYISENSLNEFILKNNPFLKPINSNENCIFLFFKYKMIALELILQLIEKIEIFQKLGIVHGDLSEDNILIKNNKIFLIDFDHSFYKKNKQEFVWLKYYRKGLKQTHLDFYSLGVLIINFFNFKNNLLDSNKKTFQIIQEICKEWKLSKNFEQILNKLLLKTNSLKNFSIIKQEIIAELNKNNYKEIAKKINISFLKKKKYQITFNENDKLIYSLIFNNKKHSIISENDNVFLKESIFLLKAVNSDFKLINLTTYINNLMKKINCSYNLSFYDGLSGFAISLINFYQRNQISWAFNLIEIIEKRILFIIDQKFLNNDIDLSLNSGLSGPLIFFSQWNQIVKKDYLDKIIDNIIHLAKENMKDNFVKENYAKIPGLGKGSAGILFALSFLTPERYKINEIFINNLVNNLFLVKVNSASIFNGLSGYAIAIMRFKEKIDSHLINFYLLNVFKEIKKLEIKDKGKLFYKNKTKDTLETGFLYGTLGVYYFYKIILMEGTQNEK